LHQILSSVSLTNNSGYEGIPFMLGEKDTTSLVSRAASGDANARLKLVKDHIGLVRDIASDYASKSDIPVSRMLCLGVCALIRSAKSFSEAGNTGFIEYARQEIVNTIESMITGM